MADVLFTITCTTCEARLNVRDRSVIGQIVTCPKCGSMVQVAPPPDWKEPAPAKPVQSAEPENPESASSTRQPGRQFSERAASNPEGVSARTQPDADSPKVAPAEPSTSRSAESKSEKSPVKKAARTAAAGLAAASAARALTTEPPRQNPDLIGEGSATESTAADTPPVQAPAEPVPPVAASSPPIAPWVSPVAAATRRWLWWGAVPSAGLAMLVGVGILFFGRDNPKPNGDPQIPASAIPNNTPTPFPVTPLSEFDTRWVPDSPQLVFTLDVASVNAAGLLEPLLKAFPSLDQAMIGSLFQGFGLTPGAVGRVCWNSDDLVDWSNSCVVVITLTEGQSTASLRSVGVPTDWQVEGLEFRQLNRPAWPRAFAILDEHTIVSGEEGVLRRLAERGEKPAAPGLLEPLLRVAPADADFYIALDLEAAHGAAWPLPVEWLDVWPQGRDAWRVIWSLPSALSFNFDRDDLALAEVGFSCAGETVADKVRVALEQWIPQAESVLASRTEGLPKSVEAGEIPAASADQYRLVLTGTASALATAHLDMADRCVWLRADCGKNSAAWTAAAADSRSAMRADWYRAAGRLDEANHGRLHEALTGYDATEKKAPPGALSNAPVPPEDVLSWITAILPYFGHESWAQELNRSYGWNSPKNRPVTSRALEAVQTPAVPVRETESGFPVTHYVGVAGIGPAAASLPRDDPRAGIFGYRESRRLTDVPDGASNTIATAGVSGKLGPWASGGAATVRAFTQQPYVNGPDGFGSGQPGGMYVGMADGSVRFLAADIDPTVLEQLVTAAGGEKASAPEQPAEQVVRVEPKPSRPSDPVPPPDEMPGVQPPADPSGEPASQTVIALAERLKAPLPGIATTNVPLVQAVRALESFGSFLVAFDLDTMSALGVTLDRPVSVRATGTTVGEGLNAVLASCGLKAVARNNYVWVTGAAEAADILRTVRYSVDDLTTSGETPASELASWIPQLIAPGTWQTRGSEGAVQANGEVLEITQSDAVQLQVLVFCERLRRARRLSPRSGRSPEQFPLASRRARAASSLQQPVTVNFFRPTALDRVIREVDGLCEAQIAVNWIALAGDGKSPSLPASLSVSQVPLGQTLDQLLGPLGLDYRAIDERTIEVTTRQDAAAHLEREFYPVGDLLAEGQTAPKLIGRLQREISPDAWEPAGGEGVVVFDKPSRCLIVLQSQRAQVAIEQWLKGLRGEIATQQ